MKKNAAPTVILASASPRRIQLLKQWGLRCKIQPSHIKENTRFRSPGAIVKDLALQKARSVASSLRKGIVIGADTIVVLGQKIIGKPVDDKDAARILGMLNGTTHRVYTGIAVIDAADGKTRTAFEMSIVKMRRLSSQEVTRLSRKHLDKAGAYAVQEKRDSFVERIEGDYFNVVGLPKLALRKLLRYFDIRF